MLEDAYSFITTAGNKLPSQPRIASDTMWPAQVLFKAVANITLMFVPHLNEGDNMLTVTRVKSG